MPQPLTAAAVVNQALQLVGGFNNNGPVTGSPPNFSGGTAAIAAGTVYDECVKTVGRKFGWDFSRNIATLLSTANTPPFGYTQEYAYPTNGIQVRQVLPPAASVNALDPRPLRWTVGNAIGGSVAATGLVSFSGPSPNFGNPTNGDTLTLNGRVFTFVSGTAGDYEVAIGGNLSGTLANLLNSLQTNSIYLNDSALNVATYSPAYSSATSFIAIAYKIPGAIGNSYTLAKSSTVITLSGATLTGGITSLQKVIWCNIASAVAVISGQPPEAAWDALYAEAVVQELASKLSLALSSKPDSAKLAAQQGIAVEQAGESRTDT